MMARMALMVGAVAVVLAVAVAIVLRGWEFASWVSAVIGAVALAGGWLARSRGGAGEGMGDTVTQTKIKAGRNVVGKRSPVQESQDRITQREITSAQDVIGKEGYPKDARGGSPEEGA